MKSKFIILLICFILCGCSSKELNNITIVTSIGIDYIDEKYQFSVLSVNAESSDISSGIVEKEVYKGTGDTLNSAMKDLQKIEPKEKYYGHISMMIISEEIAEKGIKDIIDFVNSNSKIPNGFYIFVARKASAHEVLEEMAPDSFLPGSNIIDSLKKRKSLYDSSYKQLVEVLKNGKNAHVIGMTMVEENDKKEMKLDIIAVFDKYKLKEFKKRK